MIFSWLREWRRRRFWKRTGGRLERLRQVALFATDDEVRTRAIDEANAILANVEAIGAVTHAERVELGRDWVRAWARDAIVDRFRERDALGVAQLTSFLKTG